MASGVSWRGQSNQFAYWGLRTEQPDLSTLIAGLAFGRDCSQVRSGQDGWIRDGCS